MSRNAGNFRLELEAVDPGLGSVRSFSLQYGNTGFQPARRKKVNICDHHRIVHGKYRLPVFSARLFHRAVTPNIIFNTEEIHFGRQNERFTITAKGENRGLQPTHTAFHGEHVKIVTYVIRGHGIPG